MKNLTLLRIIFVQALLAMLGSLYFSNFGDPLQWLFSGTWFDPCHLCRRTRILMYPLVWISWYGLLRRDSNIVKLILPISVAGMILTWYHYTIQHINSLNVFTCNPSNPCTLIDWKIFDYITIPALAWIAFTVITICASVIIYRSKRTNLS